jgi:hypothetical protein
MQSISIVRPLDGRLAGPPEYPGTLGPNCVSQWARVSGWRTTTAVAFDGFASDNDNNNNNSGDDDDYDVGRPDEED